MPKTVSKAESSGLRPVYVRRIAVEGLFGQFDYDLHLTRDGSNPPSNLMILYGDNGSGKTTLLRMLFHLLHPAGSAGHRGVLGRSVFNRFEVELGDNISVVAERRRGEITGPFRMTIRRGALSIGEVDWLVLPNGSVPGTKQGEVAEHEFLSSLSGLGLALYYLKDSREMVSAAQAEEPEPSVNESADEYMLRMMRNEFARRGRNLTSRMTEELQRKKLEMAVQRASDWVVERVLNASTKGDEDANAIYTGIIRRLAKTTAARVTHGRPRGGRQDLISELRILATRAPAFSRYGLIAPTDADALIASVRDARSDVLPMIREVVRPYLDGLKARMDALQGVHDRIDAFVSTLNGFYTHKRAAFQLREGLTFVAESSGTLPVRALSSGERQLLLMFCSLLTASDINGIFIVDEPELSLNVKWQRQLVAALLRFAAGTSTQFVLATHSIELLTRHKENVVRLVDVHETKGA